MSKFHGRNQRSDFLKFSWILILLASCSSSVEKHSADNQTPDQETPKIFKLSENSPFTSKSEIDVFPLLQQERIASIYNPSSNRSAGRGIASLPSLDNNNSPVSASGDQVTDVPAVLSYRATNREYFTILYWMHHQYSALLNTKPIQHCPNFFNQFKRLQNFNFKKLSLPNRSELVLNEWQAKTFSPKSPKNKLTELSSHLESKSEFLKKEIHKVCHDGSSAFQYTFYNLLDHLDKERFRTPVKTLKLLTRHPVFQEYLAYRVLEELDEISRQQVSKNQRSNPELNAQLPELLELTSKKSSPSAFHLIWLNKYIDHINQG